MLTVIFGAGASYDSDPSNLPDPTAETEDSRAARPPLAASLFDLRPQFVKALDNFPECKPIVVYLRRPRRRVSLEAELERLQAESASDPVRVEQLAAVRFYLQTVIDHCSRTWLDRTHGVTNYLTLLDQIRHAGCRSVSLVTFNYDTLIEAAIKACVGKTPTTMDSYLGLDPFALFKVHGSTDWGRVVLGGHGTYHGNETEHVVHSLIRNAAGLELGDEFRMIKAVPAAKDALGVLLPAVAVPVQTKQTFECPPTHLTALVDRLRHSKMLLIVGWRGHDQHFVELLRSYVPEGAAVHVVAGSDTEAGAVRKTLEQSWQRIKWTVHDHTFSSFVTERVGSPLFAKAASDAGV